MCQNGPELIYDTPASASQVLGLRVCAITPSFSSVLSAIIRTMDIIYDF